MVMGTKKSHGMLMVVPRNPGGPTPTMVRDVPFTTSTSPIASGDPPNSACQKSWLRTTTGWPPKAPSISGPNSRPAAGCRPRVAKYEPETCVPCTVAARP